MGVLEEILFQLTRIADAIAHDEAPPMPGKMTVVFLREQRIKIGEIEMDVITFRVSVPAEETADVVKRVLTVALSDGSPSQSEEIAGREAAVSANEFSAPQDSEVILTLVNVDDAGNTSTARVQTVIVKDTFAPPEPGEMSLIATGEVTNQ